MIKQEQLQLTCGGDQSKRRELDFYPTPIEVTAALMNFLHSECDFFFDRRLHIWEPACGNGAMSEIISLYGHDVFSSDINTEYGFNIDFLKDIDCRVRVATTTTDAIITNPPFNLSVEFINKANERSRIVCMLLKSQYWHAKTRLELFRQNPPQYVLPLTWRPDFLEHTRKPGDKKGQPTMEVAWSVWIKGSHKETRYMPLDRPTH